MSKDDLSVDGPGSPVSLSKFLAQEQSPRPLVVLVDGTGLGIAKDSEECLYITPEECAMQTAHFVKERFNGRQIPAYLYRYLTYMFIDDSKWYASDKELMEDFNKGIITEESENYKYVLGLIKWSGANKEASQVIGLIQLIGGSLSMARKEKSGIKLYLEHPETSLHPKRCSRFMSMLDKIRKEYGLDTEGDTPE